VVIAILTTSFDYIEAPMNAKHATIISITANTNGLIDSLDFDVFKMYLQGTVLKVSYSL
jgi:hypothetical protein